MYYIYICISYYSRRPVVGFPGALGTLGVFGIDGGVAFQEITGGCQLVPWQLRLGKTWQTAKKVMGKIPESWGLIQSSVPSGPVMEICHWGIIMDNPHLQRFFSQSTSTFTALIGQCLPGGR